MAKEKEKEQAAPVQQTPPADVAPSDADITDDVLGRLDALAEEVKAIRSGQADMPELLAFARKAGPLAEKIEKHTPLLEKLASMVGADPKKTFSFWHLIGVK
jgi:hypothetical protein